MQLDSDLAKHVVAVGAGAWASKDVVAKILGPTAEYLGGEIRNFAEKCNVNLSDVFKRAARKLGSRLEQPGQVNPRVLRGVINDGAFAEDDIAAEYFAGVLAAARSEDGRDDRGVAFLALIRDLSVYQLRLHYLAYSWMRAFYAGSGQHVGLPQDRATIRLFIPQDVFASLIPFKVAADNSLVDHAVLGLGREGLIAPDYAYGTQQQVRAVWANAPSAGIVIGPTQYGAELYLWAHGWGDKVVDDLLNPSITFEHTDDSNPPEGVRAVRAAEDLKVLRTEVDALAADIKGYRQRVDLAEKEGKYIPGLPLEIKTRCEYLIGRVRATLSPRAARLMELKLERVVYPPENSTVTERIEILEGITSQAYLVLKDEELGTA
jgi:hypothetical protein